MLVTFITKQKLMHKYPYRLNIRKRRVTAFKRIISMPKVYSVTQISGVIWRVGHEHITADVLCSKKRTSALLV